MAAKRATRHGPTIVEVMKEVVAIHRGDAQPAARHRVTLTARATVVQAAPEMAREEIVALREQHRLSQAVFAGVLNVSPQTVRAWEQGTRSPDGAALRLLQTARTFPGWVTAMVSPQRTSRGKVGAHEIGQ